MKFLTKVVLASALLAFCATGIVAQAADAARGKKIAWSSSDGNCLACHMMAGGELPGNFGPPMVAMKARFPDRAVLRDHVWDARKYNAQTQMPPFGAHGILDSQQIDDVIEYLYTL